jgi:hypothetical protein
LAYMETVYNRGNSSMLQYEVIIARSVQSAAPPYGRPRAYILYVKMDEPCVRACVWMRGWVVGVFLRVCCACACVSLHVFVCVCQYVRAHRVCRYWNVDANRYVRYFKGHRARVSKPPLLLARTRARASTHFPYLVWNAERKEDQREVCWTLRTAS